MTKTIFAGVIILILGLMFDVGAQEKNKLWVKREFENYGDRVYFIEDLETHTRCYAITNSNGAGNGYAISCAKQ